MSEKELRKRIMFMCVLLSSLLAIMSLLCLYIEDFLLLKVWIILFGFYGVVITLILRSTIKLVGELKDYLEKLHINKEGRILRQMTKEEYKKFVDGGGVKKWKQEKKDGGVYNG